MIELKPHTGSCRGVETDTGIDAIYVIERGTRSLVGFVGREPNADLSLIVSGLAPATVAGIKREVRARDCERAPASITEIADAGPDPRRVVEVPAVDDEDDDDEE